MKRLLLLITLLVLVPSVGWGACTAGSSPTWSNTDYSDYYGSDNVTGHDYQKVQCSSSVTIGKITLYVSNTGNTQNSSLQIWAADDNEVLGTSNTVSIISDAPAGTIKTYEFSTPVTVAEDFKVVFICAASIRVHFAYAGNNNQYFGGSSYAGYAYNIVRDQDWAMTIYFGTTCATETTSSSSTTTSTIAAATTTINPSSTATTAIPATNGTCNSAGKTGTSPYLAASCSEADIAGCITAASHGETVVIPEGSATWYGGVVATPATKPLHLAGSGAGNTVITLGGNTAIKIGEHVGNYTDNKSTRISGFTFRNTAGNSYLGIVALGMGWRIDHNVFDNPRNDDLCADPDYIGACKPYCGQPCAYYATFAIKNYLSGQTMQSYGLVDSNIFYHSKLDAGISPVAVEQAAWADALDLGGPTAWYIEDNQFFNLSDNIIKQLAIDDGYAAKRVIRYNSFTNQDIEGHPYQSAYDRGPRKIEAYGNNFYRTGITMPSSSNLYFASGTGILFDNIATGIQSAGDNSWGVTLDYKRVIGGSLNSAPACFGSCDGTASHYWDGNESGQSGHLCRDQIGTGGDIDTWDGTCSGSSYFRQSKVPLYIWNNLGAAYGDNSVYNHDTTHTVNNRDYYNRNAASCAAGGAACSAGVGCGTLAQRPTNCTTGVAYWATDQSCSDITSMTGAFATPIAGTLYKCTATNTWGESGTDIYTPYTYPHPLRTDTEESTTTTTAEGPTTSSTSSTTTTIARECYSTGAGKQNNVANGETYVVHISGTNISFASDSTMTIDKLGSIGSVTPIAYTLNSSKWLSATVDISSNATPGVWYVTVTTDGVATTCSSDGFTVSAGTVTTTVFTPTTTTSTPPPAVVPAPELSIAVSGTQRYIQTQRYTQPQPTQFRYRVNSGTPVEEEEDVERRLSIPLNGYAGQNEFSVEACYGNQCSDATSVTLKRCQCEGVTP